MSFKVTRLTVGRGKTVGDEKTSEWTKRYYEAEVLIEDERQIELAKESVEVLLDTWLKGELVNNTEEKKYDVNRIRWEEADGTRGKYERGSDVDNGDFKALLADLEEHKGKMTKDGYFYWLFSDGRTVGRKKKA